MVTPLTLKTDNSAWLVAKSELISLLDEWRTGVGEAADLITNKILPCLSEIFGNESLDFIKIDVCPAIGTGEPVLVLSPSAVLERFMAALRAGRLNGFKHIDLSNVMYAAVTLDAGGVGVKASTPLPTEAA